MVQYQPYYSASYLLAVGVNDYSDRRFMPLGDAEKDARSIADVLGAPPYGFAVTLLLGRAASKSAVLAALDALRDTRPDDRIIFYFAGHGYTLRDKQQNEFGYLACADTNPDRMYAGLRFEEVTEIRRWADAKHIGFVLDACFSGKALGLTKASVPQASAEEYMQRRAWQVLTAGGDEAVSDVHSMTGVLVQGLRDGIPDRSGPLTFSHYGQYVKDAFAERRRLQNPVCQYLEGSSNGEMVLYLPPPEQSIAQILDELETALGSGRARDRAEASAELQRLIVEGPTLEARRRAYAILEAHAARVEEQQRLAQEAARLAAQQAEAERQERERVAAAQQAERERIAAQQLQAQTALPPREPAPEPARYQIERLSAPAPLVAPEQPRRRAGQRRLNPLWISGGGLLALVMLYFGVSALINMGDGGQVEEATPPQVLVAEAATTEAPTEPAASPTPTIASEATATATLEATATLISGEAARALALAGVNSNAEWTPYIEEINGVAMALVPKGCFQMGSNDGGSEQQPVHEVCFEQPYWIDLTEVTNEQYGAAASGCIQYSNDPEQPHVCINWADSLAHCESRGARLPTEAEWEFAARGPDGRVYPWGDEFIAENVVYYGNSGSRTWDVGSKPGGVSWVGALDLSGNVWEWVNDWYGTYPAERQVNPQGADSGTYRLLRGGSWYLYDSVILRGADRNWTYPTNSNGNRGFRCALSY